MEVQYGGKYGLMLAPLDSDVQSKPRISVEVLKRITPRHRPKGKAVTTTKGRLIETMA